MDLKKFCKKYLKDLDYTINSDETIDINGDVNIDILFCDAKEWRSYGSKKLLIKFGKIHGDFICNKIRLYTLEGCPSYVSGDFMCFGNELHNLNGCPKYVGGNFNCVANKLTSLEGCPKYVGGNFNCDKNTTMTTLKGIERSEIGGDFNCETNNKILLENYKFIVSAKIGGKITVSKKHLNSINNVLNSNKNCNIEEINNIIVNKINEAKFKKIEIWCRRNLSNYTINPDGTIDVDGNVELYKLLGSIRKLSVKFGKVSGDFDCSINNLTSLEGCPNYVGGDFDCSMNSLVSLEGCPNYVGGMFNCDKNKLTTLEYCPEHVGKNMLCSMNRLSTLRFKPKYVGGDFFCLYNMLKSATFGEVISMHIDGEFKSDYKNINDIIKTYKNSQDKKDLIKAYSLLSKIIIVLEEETKDDSKRRNYY
jgi:hypothetical protein